MSRDPGALRVALVMVAVGDLSGSGGAERQFSEVFEHLLLARDVEVSLITSATSVRRLREAGKLDRLHQVVELPLGAKPAQSRLSVAWMTLTLLFATIGRGLDVVHICLPTPSYVPYAAVVGRLPRRWRPAVTITVVDCTLAHNLSGGSPADTYERQVLDAHHLYARWTAPDGVFSWYEAFTATVRTLGVFSAARVVSARFCFTDPVRFQPGTKQRLIVWAGRLSTQKRPLLFVDAVAALCREAPQLVEGWRFEMYGAGVLEAQVRARLREQALESRLTLTKAPDLSPVFAVSSLFVSTQAHENFTSLAMLEAMAAGNSVIAEDAGQTRVFVSDANGLLVDSASAQGFGAAMARYLEAPQAHSRMAAASRSLATEVHTIEHFAEDIVGFWRTVAAGA